MNKITWSSKAKKDLKKINKGDVLQVIRTVDTLTLWH